MGVTPAPRETFRDALSVALTVGAYGVAFGAAGIAAHFSVALLSTRAPFPVVVVGAALTSAVVRHLH